MSVVPSKPNRKLGAIYPDDVWVDVDARELVAEYERFMPAGVDLLSVCTPIPAGDNTLAMGIELAANGDIEEAAARLSRYEPEFYAYYCTTISFARGMGGDLDISKRIAERTGKPATTTSTAMIAAFRRLGIQTVAVASPYLPDVEQAFVSFIEDHGFRVVNRRSLCLAEHHSLVVPDNIRQLAESADRSDADAIFVGCTGQKLAEHISAMEAKLGKPVLTANQVTSWHALELMGLAPKLPNRGRLFS